MKTASTPRRPTTKNCTRARARSLGVNTRRACLETTAKRTSKPTCTYDNRRRLESCSKDPIGFLGKSESLYAYVVGKPLSLVDPDGEKWTLTPNHPSKSSELLCPRPCSSGGNCKFELDTAISTYSLPWSYVGSLTGEPPENIDVLELQIHYSPEKPDIVGDLGPLDNGESGIGACYGGYNRASGSITYTLRSGTKCQLDASHWPNEGVVPLPPGDSGLSQECFEVMLRPWDGDPNRTGWDGADYRFDLNDITNIHFNFEIETECHCGIGHCDLPGVPDEYHTDNSTHGTLSINRHTTVRH